MIKATLYAPLHEFIVIPAGVDDIAHNADLLHPVDPLPDEGRDVRGAHQ